MTGLRLVLARHAETDANLRLVLDSLPPGPPLNDLGRRQAAELAETLAVEPVAGVYASTAIRAKQTAQPVADRHGLPVDVVPGLHEVFMGDLEGTEDEASMRIFMGVAKAWSEGDLDRAMPGGESAREAVDRFTTAVKGIRERHSHGVLVVVSHGALLRLGAPSLAANLQVIDNLPLLPNTGRIVLDEDAGTPTGWRAVLWTGVPLN
ncbi:MAG TPA: histidine phosphatase family protein [Pseudonocardiaceae bacterium]|nr:histidine phosphatase family protein [Pseudonocardiaceae bacterium]